MPCTQTRVFSSIRIAMPSPRPSPASGRGNSKQPLARSCGRGWRASASRVRAFSFLLEAGDPAGTLRGFQMRVELRHRQREHDAAEALGLAVELAGEAF